MLPPAVAVGEAFGDDPEGDANRYLKDYYASRGIDAEVRPLDLVSDMGSALIAVAEREGAGLLVAGAFGRTRLREFIFGGATRTLLHGDGPSLFLAH